MKRGILFVVTTAQNMGDLALCQEWIADLGREDHRFAFVLHGGLTGFIDARDAVFVFDPDIDVAQTIAEVAHTFRPDAVVLASNSFWNIPGQRGAIFGRYPPTLFTLGIPLLSFDPFEIPVRTVVPYSGEVCVFPEIPPGVARLQYMSRETGEPGVFHFCTNAAFERARTHAREDVLRSHGLDPRKRTVVFPISRNRFGAIHESFPLYYLHLAKLLARPELTDVQFAVVAPGPIPGLRHAANVTFLPHLPFDAFLALTAASDLYLSDSLISCMVNAFHLAIPVVLLANSGKHPQRAAGTFLGERFFPYKLFPYGFSDVCDALINRFEIAGCFVETEVLDEAEFGATLGSLVPDGAAYCRIADHSRAWKDARSSLPSPRATLERILLTR